jgi:asparagine synthase (glutamine-hydrolysing)
MRDTMQHRGPDDAGVWRSADGCVGLGQRRLAIIDLSPGGHQPMCDATGGCWITYNGEIYNYRELRRELQALGQPFRTQSDTEVILAAYNAWGAESLSRLSGMFAFGLYDSRTRCLLLARDRAGEKPLYYRHTDDGLVFASELKALLADPRCPRRLDLEAVDQYFAYGYVPGARCILQGISKLPQGHAMLFDVGRNVLKVWPYWTLPDAAPDPGGSVEDLCATLETLLEDSVRRQLVADVPVGVLLSGGIDSSLVTAMAARVSSEPVRTFTITFPGYEAYNEAGYARLVAAHFGTRHTELAAEPATAEILPDLARQYDEPLGDSSMVPTYLVSRLIRRHATVALGGDGGDELFGGYLHYAWVRRQELARRVLPAPLRAAVSRAASRLLPPGVRGRHYVIGLAGDVAHSIAHANLFFDHRSRGRLLAPLAASGAWPSGRAEEYKAGLCADGRTGLQQATRADFRAYLVDDILVKVDRASMLTSLEVRAPWLDPRIIELAFGRLPDALRAVGSERKILPRRLAARLLPAALDLDGKRGFAIPLDEWLRGDWGRYVESVLGAAEEDIFDRAEIAWLLANHRRGLSNGQRLFALTMFELWRREYRVARG